MVDKHENDLSSGEFVETAFSGDEIEKTIEFENKSGRAGCGCAFLDVNAIFGFGDGGRGGDGRGN